MVFMDKKVYLITGAAGFIGSSLIKELLNKEMCIVIGVDNINNSYDINLKKYRLKPLLKRNEFHFYQINILNLNDLEFVFKKYIISTIIHLAARAGVRLSLNIPELYYRENVIGTLNILKLMKKYSVKNIIAASTSSVYSSNELNEPFKEDFKVSSPNSPYAASKIAMENLLYTWSYLYKINVCVVRYFTVYGPCSRPDMAILKFLISIYRKKWLTVFGDGNQLRDFTYIDDAVKATTLILNGIEKCKINKFSIFNVGSENPVTLNKIISLLEKFTGLKAGISYSSMPLVDSKKTHSCSRKLNVEFNWIPSTSIEDGVRNVVDDFRLNLSMYLKLVI
jgi:UDP-glucuronate 4-epimerase